MRDATVFHLAPGTLTLQRWSNGELREALAAPATPEGAAALAVQCNPAKPAPALLLIDVAEEEFAVENVPRLFWRERRHFLRRRAERLFPSGAQKAVFPLRNRRQRGQERVLFSGVTLPETVALCLDKLAEARIPLRAVSSVPHVSAALPRALGINEPFLLFTTVQTGGLRLSYFRDGELCASRLSPVAAAGANVVEELARTRRYLKNSGLLPSGEVLVVYCLVEEPLLATLEATSPPDGLDLRLGDIAEAATHLGIGYQAAVGASALFAGLFIRSAANRYGDAGQLRVFRNQRASALIEWAGLLLALLLCGAGVSAASHALEERRTTALVGTTAPPATDVDLPDGLTVEQLRSSVETAELQLRREMTPRPALKALGAVLQRHPAITLRRIEWASSPDHSLSEAPPEMAKTFSLSRTQSFDAAPPWQALFAEADVTVTSGGLRRANGEVTAFVKELEGIPSVTGAEVVLAPVDQEGPLRGSAGRAAPSPAPLPFAFRVIVRP